VSEATTREPGGANGEMGRRMRAFWVPPLKSDLYNRVRKNPLTNRLRLWFCLRTDELAEKRASEQCGLAVVAVVHFDDVERVGVWRDASHQFLALSRAESTGFGRTGSGRERRVGDVDVDRAVHRTELCRRLPFENVLRCHDGHCSFRFRTLPANFRAASTTEHDQLVGDVQGVMAHRRVTVRVSIELRSEIEMRIEHDNGIRLEGANPRDAHCVLTSEEDWRRPSLENVCEHALEKVEILSWIAPGVEIAVICDRTVGKADATRVVKIFEGASEASDSLGTEASAGVEGRRNIEWGTDNPKLRLLGVGLGPRKH